MDINIRQQSHWAQLPPNLWAEILLHHHPSGATSFEAESGRWRSPQSQAWFFKLRTVCQAFDEVFEAARELSSNILVTNQLKNQHIPLLVDWLHYRHVYIKQLELKQGSPWLEAVLATLQSPHTSLRKVIFSNIRVPDTAMFLLSTFRTIAECTFHLPQYPSGPYKYEMELKPLQALPQLKKLALKAGKFSGLEAAAHLTYLSVNDGELTCVQSCSCVTTLSVLALSNAKLNKFHKKGLSACSQLQFLECHDGFIGANDMDELFDGQTVPSELSSLTRLTNLVVSCSEADVRLDWVTRLSALQYFQLKAQTVNCPASWNSMTNLKTLLLEVCANSRGSQPNMCWSFDWPRLKSLETVKLDGVKVVAQKIANLAMIDSLKEVWLTHVKKVDAETATEIALLALEIGTNKPNVKFHMFAV